MAGDWIVRDHIGTVLSAFFKLGGEGPLIFEWLAMSNEDGAA